MGVPPLFTPHPPWALPAADPLDPKLPGLIPPFLFPSFSGLFFRPRFRMVVVFISLTTSTYFHHRLF
jgi:hypothetical protein